MRNTTPVSVITCERWISDNADGKGDGWHPYTISLRLTNLWICLDGFEGRVQEDQVFFLKLTDSMYAQYLHLQKNWNYICWETIIWKI